MAVAFIARFKVKDPGAFLDYSFDWGSKWLGTDTIATSSWSVSPAGPDITSHPDTHTSTTTTVWMGGGTEGQDYLLKNTITTVGGRTDERTILVRLENL